MAGDPTDPVDDATLEEWIRTAYPLGDPPVIAETPPTTPMTRWAPLCPLGYPQRPVAGVAHRDKGDGIVQIRVPMRHTESVCCVIVQESFELVLVRVILCCEGGVWDDGSEVFDCPAKAYLDDDLDDRWIIDIESGRRLPPWRWPR